MRGRQQHLAPPGGQRQGTVNIQWLSGTEPGERATCETGKTLMGAPKNDGR